jgi:hypothetical protein
MSSMDIDTWEEVRKQRRRKVDVSEGQRVDFVTKLGAAKHALTLATEIPDITELLDNAEAVRAAAKAKHVSTPGVNAWTRFVVDVERKGWARIEAMQKAGELPKGSGRPSKKSWRPTLTLEDLVAKQRASEWSILAKLTEFQLDEMERIANDEDRLLTRAELLRLAQRSMPKAIRQEIVTCPNCGHKWDRRN